MLLELTSTYLEGDPTMNVLRKIAGIGVLLFALNSFWVALESPMAAAQTPIIIGIGCIVLTFVVWPKEQIGR
jgi:hypothetical protein